MMGLEEDPEDHKAVAASIFIAVAVYGVRCSPLLLTLAHADTEQAFLLFCGSQAYLHVRASRRGAISLR